MSAPTGMILFAHGARDPRWAEPFEAIAAQLREQAPGLQVRLAYLEFMSPSLAQAAQQLADEGCRMVHVLPLFLGAGGHVRKDLPQLLQHIGTLHPHLRLQLHPAIGEQSAVVQAMARAAAALVGVDQTRAPSP